MITHYFDINQRQIVQSPGTLAAAVSTPWVYGDNYNVAVYLCASGQILTPTSGDTLTAMLYQQQYGSALPSQNLALIGTVSQLTDVNGLKYFLFNVNLKTTQLAALVQTPNQPAQTDWVYIFSPADQERFSSSAVLAITINPDPSQTAAGSTPVPPGYPTNPNVFEQVANKNNVNGYPGLDPNAHLNPNQIPTDTTLTVTGGKLSVIGGGGGGGNPYVAVIPAQFNVPATGATVAVTMGAAVPDMLAGQSILVTDGAAYIQGAISAINGTSLTILNNGSPGATTGVIGPNAHIYLGNAAGPVTTIARGTVRYLPTTTPTKLLYRGDDTYAQANYPDLSNIPTTFPPVIHGSQHISTGADPIPTAATTATGLMPARSGPAGTYLDVTGSWSTPAGGGGGTAWVGTIAASFVIPAAGITGVAISLAAVITDLVVGMSILITDGTHEATFLVTIVSGTSVTATCTGTANSGATMANGSHVYFAVGKHGITHTGVGADPIPAATTSATGLVQPDGISVNVNAGGVVSVPTATTSAKGLVRPDGTSITITGAGVISAAGGSIAGIARARIYTTTVQSIPTGNSPTQVTLGSVDFDTAGFTTNANALTFVNAGLYLIGFVLPFVVQGTGFRGGVVIANGNSALFFLDVAKTAIPSAWSGMFDTVAGTTIRSCAANDYITLNAIQNSGSALNTASNSAQTDCPCLWAIRIA